MQKVLAIILGDAGLTIRRVEVATEGRILFLDTPVDHVIARCLSETNQNQNQEKS